MQDLVSLLLQDTDSGPEPASAQAPGLAPDAPRSDTAADTSTASINPAVNPHPSVGSHFQGPQNPAEPHRADVKSPVGTSAWADELGGKITWMAKHGIESASLSLSPDHLGPVEVHISVQDGAASVMFGAAQPDTRSALEHALPQLRQMFASQGLALADAGVSRERPKQHNRPAQIAPVSSPAGVADESVTSMASPLRVRLGLLDTYA
jgi:flagellar hook-length control protein FliK